MKKESWSIVIVALALIAFSAVFLVQLQAKQRLGTPGLKLVAAPVHDPQGNVIATNTIDLPHSVFDLESKSLPVTEIELNWLPKDTTYGRRAYRAPDGFEAAISIVLMGADRTSIHKPEYCLLGQGWTIEKVETTVVPMSRPHAYDLPIRKMTLKRSYKDPSGKTVDVTGLYVFWFVADGQITAEHGDRMWRMAKDLLQRGVLERWAYVTYFTQCRAGYEEVTFERLKDFIQASVPEFQLAAGERTTRQTAALE